MKFRRVIMIVALCSTSFASAQIGGGQSGMSTSAPLSNVDAFGDLRMLGMCVAKSERSDALKLIATTPGSPEEARLFKKLFSGERYTCLFGGTKMSMPIVFARGAVAEGLLQTGGVPPSYRLAALDPPAYGDLHGAARCYAADHRSAVDALLQTAPGSPKEVAAAAVLWEDFRKCMPGFKVRLSAPWIRFLLAEAVLRLPPATPTAGG